MFCPRCGAEHEPDQRFCSKCGAVLGTAENPQSVAAAGSAPTVAAASVPIVHAVPQPTPAPPQPSATSLHPIPDEGLTLEEIVAWLQSGGYSAQVVTGESGKRHIESSSQGARFNIMTPGCQSGRCATLEFLFGYSCGGKFDVSHINEWNGQILWCRAYTDSVNDPWLEMDIALGPGVTYESLNHQFSYWNDRLGRFIAAYGLR
jgi:hypothetical protein